jgi:hypothetical protein
MAVKCDYEYRIWKETAVAYFEMVFGVCTGIRRTMEKCPAKIQTGHLQNAG